MASGSAGARSAPWYVRRLVLLVAALYLVVVLVELAAPIARGQWYTAGDLGQEFSVTALPHPPEPVKNPLQGDVYSEIDPNLKVDVQSIRSGHLPLWNPNNGNGEPFLAGLIPAPFSPFTVPFYLLPFAAALVVTAALKLWCLAFFTFLWLRRLLRKDLAAVLGGVLFAFAGFHILWLNWQVQVNSAAALPFGLWCAQVGLDHLGSRPDSPDEARRRRRVLRLCVAGGAVALAGAILGGHPEVVIFDSVIWVLYCLAGGIYQLGLGRRLIRWLAATGVAAAIGLGVSAAALLPALQYQAVSSHGTYVREYGLPEVASFHKTEIPMLAFPNLFGSPSTTYDDSAFYAEYGTNYPELNGAFMGLVALCLAPLGIAGLFVRRTRFVAGFALGLSAIGLLLLYTKLGAEVWTSLPVAGDAVLNRSQDILILGTVTLAAVGVDWLLSGPARGPLRDWRWRAGIGVATALSVTLVAGGGARWLRRHVEQGVGGLATAHGSPYVRGQVAIQVACVAAVVFLLVLLMRRTRRRWEMIAASGGVVAATCVSVMLPLIAWNPTIPASMAYPETKDLTALRGVVGNGLSAYLGGAFPVPMSNAWFGLADVGSYDAAGVLWRDDLYDRAFGLPSTFLEATNARAEQMPACIEDLRLFGIEHVVGGAGVFGNSSRLTPRTVKGPLPFTYYDVPDSGLVSLVGRSATLAGDATAMAAVTNCAFDPNSEVVLSPDRFVAAGQSPASPMTGNALGNATARVVGRSQSTLAVDTTAKAAGWLVIRQTWFPGWQAEVDGHPTALRRADVAFQAVQVPAGSHRVSLRYAPAVVSRGIALSLAAVALIVLVCLWAAMDWPFTEWAGGAGRRRKG